MTEPSISGYAILEKLGEGGMGTVYRAVHKQLNASRALKVLRRELWDDPDAVSRFENEIVAVGRLGRHPNVVQAHDAGKSEGVFYLAMELVEGLDFAEILSRLGPLQVTDSCEAMRRAALGLQHAHEHQLVHRDIKPSNVMLAHESRHASDVEVKVADLGLARLLDPARSRDSSAHAHILGTLSYMAPEQFFAPATVDIRADIYSLGCTLYALLVGRPPFEDLGLQDWADPVASRRRRVFPVERLRATRPDIQEPLIEMLQYMMARDPAERFQTPEEVAKSLRIFSGGHDLAALLAEAEGLPSVAPAAAPATNGVSGSANSTSSFSAAPDADPGGSQGEPDPLAVTGDWGPAPTSDSAPKASSEEAGLPAAASGEAPPSAGNAPFSSAPASSGDASFTTPFTRWRGSWLYGVGAAVILAVILAVAAGRALRRQAAPTDSQVDVLAQLQLERDVALGHWAFEGSELVSARDTQNRLRLPVTATSDFQLEIEAASMGQGSLVLLIPWADRQWALTIPAVRAVRPDTLPAVDWPDVPAPLRLGDRDRGATLTCRVCREGLVLAQGSELLCAVFESQVFALPPCRVSPTESPDESPSLFVGTEGGVYRLGKIHFTRLR